MENIPPIDARLLEGVALGQDHIPAITAEELHRDVDNHGLLAEITTQNERMGLDEQAGSLYHKGLPWMEHGRMLSHSRIA